MSRESSKYLPRVGHCRWKAVVYEPGKLEGYDDQFVACVFPCHATKVTGKSVYYYCGENPYIAGFKFWRKLHPTRRAAVRAALAMLAAAQSQEEGK